jgi:hypothetical protein
MNHSTDILFVAWQDPNDRRYFPVGRLIRQQEGGAPAYEFAYLQGARCVLPKGFQPFMAFPNLEAVYRGDELFPFFSNRLLSRSRPDFADYVSRLGIDPNAPDDFAILARSGGGRATDSVEIFPFPSGVEDNTYTTYFCAHSLRHLPPASREWASTLKVGDRLFMMHDCQNPVDPYTLALRTEDRMIVGYLPTYLLEDAWRLAGGCGYIDFEVAQVNLPSAPLNQMLLCKMSSCWPDPTFVPFSSAEYQPIASDALRVNRGVVELAV